MSAHPSTVPVLLDHLTEPLRLGEPDVHGPLAVFPVFGPAADLEYVSFTQGHAGGVAIKELDTGASVNDLIVVNPTGAAVLLYEGEEVLGAQQNRTFDTSVLVAAGSQLRVPVSCVEAGRWDGSRHAEHFTPAPQAAYPELRRLKNQAVRASMAAGAGPRADQSGVWQEVAGKSERMATRSDSGAMHDIFEGRRGRLDEFVGAVQLRDGQIGALAAVGGTISVLDHVSRSDVFAALHGPLVQGYALDALEAGDGAAPSLDEAGAFLERVMAAHVSEHDGIGVGRDVRFTELGLGGAGLVAGNELIQLSAFAESSDGNGSGPSASAARIRRPSRRRGA